MSNNCFQKRNVDYNADLEDAYTPQYFSGFEFDDHTLISEKFYRHTKIKNDKYASRAKTTSFYKPIDRSSKALEEIKELFIQNVPSKVLERQRKSIYLR